MTFAFADDSIQEENKQREKEDGYQLQDIDIDDVFCLKEDPTKIFVIIDQYDRVITQGRCTGTMVKYFLSISDPLFEIDNIKYFRLGYENPEIMKQRLIEVYNLQTNLDMLP
jgi:hypothetical protein